MTKISDFNHGRNDKETERVSDVHTTENVHPIVNANWLSRLTLWWMTGLFIKAYKRPLAEDDLFPILDYYKAERNGVEFEKRWTNLPMKERLKKGSLLKHLLLHFKKLIGLGMLLELIAEICRFAIPMLVAVVVQYLDGSGQTSPLTAYVCTAIIIVSSLVLVPLNAQYFLIHYCAGMVMRSTCASLIYKKCMMTLHALLMMPLGMIAFIIFGSITSGYAVIVGLLIASILFGVRLVQGKWIGKFRRTQEAWTRKRVDLMSEIITAMKVIKMYCWEKPFSRKAKEIRAKETLENFKRTLLSISSWEVSQCIGTYILYFMQITAHLLKQDITPAATIRLMGFLRGMLVNTFSTGPGAFGMIFEAIGSTELLKKFLMTEDFYQEPLELAEADSEVIVKMNAATAVWDKDLNDRDGKIVGPTLKAVNLIIQAGELLGVTGEVGSGKSSLIMAILGELAITEGECQVKGSIAYVPQEAWVMSDTFRSNIVMDADFEKDRYDKVLWACALNIDIDTFPDGDITLVGERGLSLSGGQKARLNLARAVYQDADIFLLDDPLAAVDGKVGQHIFTHCIRGLLKTKLCILVTHNLQYLPLVDRIVVLDKGSVVLSGRYNNIMDKLGKYTGAVHENSLDSADTATPSVLSSMKSQVENMEGLGEFKMPDKEADTHIQNKERPDPTQRKGMENISQGELLLVFLRYIKAGGLLFFVLMILLAISVRMAELSSSWVMSQWISTFNNVTSYEAMASEPLSGYDDTWFVGIGGALALFVLVTSTAVAFLQAIFLTTASRRLYNQMFDVILRAPMYFLETNPVGQILNRFSRDTGFMDIILVMPFNLAIFLMLVCAAITVFACVVFPMMTILAAAFIIVSGIFMHFVSYLIKDIKRVEAGLRSPTYSHLSTTIQGITVIRAFRKQDRFLADAHKHIDRHTSAWHTYLCMTRFIGMRVDFYSSVLIAIYLLVRVLTSTPGVDINAGETGMSFIYLVWLLGTFQYALLQIAEVTNIMMAVERIQQFGGLEQEAQEYTDIRPGPGWPSLGQIEFKDMTLTYKGQKRPALGPISVKIQPGEKVGVVGRTGAGKSSLFVSLLRMVEPSGSIQIDGVEVTNLGLTDLRSNISVIPQDPVLFTGCLRDNLDPFEEYNDDQLWTSLKQVQLHHKVTHILGGLTAETGEAGDNFSVGEKQLLCMARALLRKNKVIIIDEATANVDYRTDRIIQETLSSEFGESTVLTIAHRLNTIILYDKIMVLETGKLVEFDHPHILLQDSSSLFHQMLLNTGDEAYTDMREQAEQSYNSLRRMERDGLLQTVPLNVSC